MAKISCSCGHWNKIGMCTNYCERCGRQLDTDVVTELMGMDARATRELQANPAGLRYGLMVTFLFAFVALPFFKSGPMYWGTVILFFLLLSALIRWIRKRIFARYHRLWELPETFRPTVPKS